MPKSISNLSGYVNQLKQLQANAEAGAVYLFRGQEKIYANAIPKCFRDEGHRDAEREMLLRLMSQSPREFQDDRYAFDRLVRAQHYGIPTRLLDVTVNPLTALYFAVCGSHGDRGQVIIYKTHETKMKFFNSDTVSCMSNLANLTEQERTDLDQAGTDAMKQYFKEFKSRELAGKSNAKEMWEELIKDFNKAEATRRLVQFIREEKPYFDNRIDPVSVHGAIPVIPKQSNSRISAQSGAFFLFGLSSPSSNRLLPTVIKDIHIGNDRKGPLLKELDALGISAATVFPELDKIAGVISDRARKK